MVPIRERFVVSAGEGHRMSNASWILVGMLTAGARGALGVWLPATAGLWGESPEEHGMNVPLLVLAGSVIVASVGGLLSVGRGGPAGLGGWGFRILVIAAGVPLVPFLILMIGVTLPALFGGLIMLPATWTILARLGVRPGRPVLGSHAAGGERDPTPEA